MVIAENITKSYAKTAVLDNVNFSVNKGELFGIIGPDGAGKTTLFNIISTLILPDKGKVTVDGFDVIKDYTYIRKNIGYVPDKFSLYQDLTVEENLNFFATVFNTSIEQNYNIIKDIYQQIEPFKKRKAGALSGGMKQKLALSCALIHYPTILLLDEPTTGVDSISRKEFWAILKKLNKKGITILVSTPYMDEANLCDRIALIQKGKVFSINTPEDTISNYPETLYSMKSANNYQLLQTLKKRTDIKSCYISGKYIHAVFNTNYSPSIDNVEISQVKPSIEDCFIYLMNLK